MKTSEENVREGKRTKIKKKKRKQTTNKSFYNVNEVKESRKIIIASIC